MSMETSAGGNGCDSLRGRSRLIAKRIWGESGINLPPAGRYLINKIIKKTEERHEKSEDAVST
jgi:hypothetical protein